MDSGSSATARGGGWIGAFVAFIQALTAVLLLAGGHVGVLGALLWSVALGCLVAGVMLALTPGAPLPGLGADDGTEITIRGPSTYAGPGSLGGTESALRR